MTAQVLRTPINTLSGILASRDLDNSGLGDGLSSATLVSGARFNNWKIKNVKI